MSWRRYTLNKRELGAVRYIDYSYWNELSGGSRLPVDAACNIRAGKVVCGQSNERYGRMVEALRGGAAFPELVLVATRVGAPLVVLEGHMRITAYSLAPECVPAELTAIIGFSPEMTKWMALTGEK